MEAIFIWLNSKLSKLKPVIAPLSYITAVLPQNRHAVLWYMYSHTHDLACGGLHQTRLMVFKGQLLPPSHYTFRRLTLSSARLFGDVGGMEEGEEMGVGMGEGEGEGV